MAAKAIEELNEMLVRGDDILDIHHSFFFYFYNQKAVLSELSYADKLVKLVKIFWKFYDVFGIGIFWDKLTSVKLLSVFVTDQIDEAFADKSPSFNFCFRSNEHPEAIVGEVLASDYVARWEIIAFLRCKFLDFFRD